MSTMESSVPSAAQGRARVQSGTACLTDIARRLAPYAGDLGQGIYPARWAATAGPHARGRLASRGVEPAVRRR